MEKIDLDTLARRVISDPVFRNRLLVDPETAIHEAGWDLPLADLAALKTWHANLRDVTKLEELERALAAFVAGRRSGKMS